MKKEYYASYFGVHANLLFQAAVASHRLQLESLFSKRLIIAKTSTKLLKSSKNRLQMVDLCFVSSIRELTFINEGKKTICTHTHTHTDRHWIPRATLLKYWITQYVALRSHFITKFCIPLTSVYKKQYTTSWMKASIQTLLLSNVFDLHIKSHLYCAFKTQPCFDRKI